MTPQRRRADRGSATVWSLGIVAVLLTLFAAGLFMGQAVVLRHRAGAAADLAALAAADHALDGPRAACALASEVARAQGALLADCTVTGEVSDVVAKVGGAKVRSRAGPSFGDPSAVAPSGVTSTVGARPVVAGGCLTSAAGVRPAVAGGRVTSAVGVRPAVAGGRVTSVA